MSTPVPLDPGQDAWVRARATLPAAVTIYRPSAAVPDRFGEAELWEACVDPQTGPRYTVRYLRGDAEALVFILNQGALAWGNTPGPPTSIEQITVRGVTGRLTITESRVSGQVALPPFYDRSWRENGSIYQIKASSAQITRDDLRQIAEALVAVR